MLMYEYSTNISNAHQLQLAGTTLGANYTLANDIDLNSAFTNVAEVWGTNKNTPTGEGFYPIGAAAGNVTTTYYTGVFDGNNHTINNLYINLNNTVASSSKDTNVGLFGNIGSAGMVKNIGLTNANVTHTSTATNDGIGLRTTGALAGKNNGTITNSYTSGSVSMSTSTPFADAGGFVGFNNGIIRDSYNLADISNMALTGGNSTRTTAGGLVGINWDNGTGMPGTITTSYSSGNVTITFITGSGGASAGGFIGGNHVGSVASTSISNSYSTGNVTALGAPTLGTTFAAGGFAGYNITNLNTSYSSGLVSAPANYYSGGFIGYNTIAEVKSISFASL